MRRPPFVIALIALTAAVTWALLSGAAAGWATALILFAVAVFLSPWIPGAGDNWDDSFGDGGSGV